MVDTILAAGLSLVAELVEVAVAVPELAAVSFAGLLRRLRTIAGLTQEELAEAVGVSARSVSDLERGVSLTARKDTARLLADALNLEGAERAAFDAAARGRPLAGMLAGATRTLPRDIASFTGREPELGMLTGAVERAGAGQVVGVHAIGGMAGVGKTAFAVHAAHRLAPRFPDGQIFLHLHGHTPGHQAVGPMAALAGLLLAVGVTGAQIPSGQEARTALWRDRLAGRQVPAAAR
jgi:transcriptional regulator with XRE-family HTH domain